MVLRLFYKVYARKKKKKKKLTILGKQFLRDFQIGLQTYHGRFSNFEILEKKKNVWGLDTISLIFFLQILR